MLFQMATLTETDYRTNMYYTSKTYRIVHRMISYYLRWLTRGQRLEREDEREGLSMKWNDPCDDNSKNMNQNKNDMIARVIEILIVVSLNHVMYMKSSQQQSTISNENENENENEETSKFNFDHLFNSDSYEHEHEHEHEHIGKRREWNGKLISRL